MWEGYCVEGGFSEKFLLGLAPGGIGSQNDIRSPKIGVVPNNHRSHAWCRFITASCLSRSLCIAGNTRVISQSSLQKFQEEIGNVIRDPYQFVLKPSKLPLSLLHERAKVDRDVDFFQTET